MALFVTTSNVSSFANATAPIFFGVGRTYVIEEWDGSLEVVAVHHIEGELAVMEYHSDGKIYTMDWECLCSQVVSEVPVVFVKKEVRYAWQPLRRKWRWEIAA